MSTVDASECPESSDGHWWGREDDRPRGPVVVVCRNCNRQATRAELAELYGEA